MILATIPIGRILGRPTGRFIFGTETIIQNKLLKIERKRKAIN